MKEFPSEVLAIIFSYVETPDHLEFMRVCRLWESTIRYSNLLQTVRLSQRTQFLLLSQFLESNSDLGNQARSLVLGTDIDPFDHDHSILPYLPNLKVLYTTSYTQLLLDGQVDPEFSSSHLEHLVVNNYPAGTYSSHPFMDFPNLKTLAVNCDQFGDNYLVDLILHSPAITELTLSFFDIELETMETIHSGLPLLTKLTIHNATLNYTQELGDIRPCNSLTSFRTVFTCPSQGEIGGMEDKWLTYIRLKYPNMTEFMFRSFAEPSFTDLISTVISMDQAPQLFLKLGSKLKKLDFYRSDIPSFYFDALDDNGYQLDELSIVVGGYDNLFMSMIKSNQAGYIQTLTISDVELSEVELLTTMRVLKDLTLDFNGLEIMPMHCLGDIIKVCPTTLKSLTLKFVNLYHEAHLPHLDSVERLKFVNAMFDKHVDGNLNWSFPKTKSLTFDACYFVSKKLNLPDFDLYKLEVARKVSYWNKHLVVKTSKDNGVTTYTVGHVAANHSGLRHYSVICNLDLCPPTKRSSGVPNDAKICLELNCYAARNVTFFH